MIIRCDGISGISPRSMTELPASLQPTERAARSSPPTTGSGTTGSDHWGSVTLRHNSRLHHIGLGARLAGTSVSLLIDDLHIRIIHRHTGELIRELILDPTRDYQPRGLPPGPPKQTAATPRAASRSRPAVPPAAEVKAGRRPPAPNTLKNATRSGDTCQRRPETSHWSRLG
jgi:hypothetical protein